MPEKRVEKERWILAGYMHLPSTILISTSFKQNNDQIV